MSLFNNMTIGKKVFTAVALILILMTITNGLVFLDLKSVSDDSEKISKTYVPETEEIIDMQNYSYEAMYHIREYGLTADESYLELGLESLSNLKYSINNSLNMAKTSDEIDESNFTKALQIVDEYENLIKQTLETNEDISYIVNSMGIESDIITGVVFNYLEEQNTRIGQEINDNFSNEEIEDRLKKITLINNIADLINKARIENFKFQATGDVAALEKSLEYFPLIEENVYDLQDLTVDLYYLAELSNILSSSKSYENSVKRYFENNQTLNSLNSQRTEKGSELLAITNSIADNNMNLMGNISDTNTAAVSRTIALLIGGLIATLVISLLFFIPIVRGISKSLGRVKDMLGEMSKGHLQERLNINTKDEVGQMAQEMDSFMDNLQGNVIANLDKLSNGDLDTDIKIIDEKDEIGPALKKTRDSIQALSDETKMIIKAAVDGSLDTRADEDKFEGEYKSIIGGLNTTIEVLVGHIDSVPTPVMIIDTEYNIKYMNKAGAEVLQKSQNQLIGQKCYDNFKTGDCNTENCSCFKAMKNGDKASSKTKANPNGQNLDINYSGLPLKDNKGKIIGAFEFIVDETDIKNAQRLAEKQGKFQEKQVAKLVHNLEELSKGNLDIDPEKIEADEDTILLADNFKRINSNLKESTNAIKSYVKEISDITGEMAKGNMDLGIDREYRGDFVEIKDSLNLIIDKLNENFAEIANASDQVSSGASQISDGSQELSQGSTEQASSIEELTASITQIAAQTKQNAGNAEEANEVSVNMKSNASRGNKSMNNMLSSMKDINESSQNIQNIIKVIDDIAFQTNLLALNAAVEAARAGQHGKGFAVVAEEVRNLAGRSAEAAKETTKLIEGSIKDVEKGTDIANETAKALEDIVQGIDKTSELVSQISSASNEQATGVAQINDGIEQVSEVVQNNSATAEESAAASEELASQAEMLKEMVAQFKLRDSLQNRIRVKKRKPSHPSLTKGLSKNKVPKIVPPKKKVDNSDNSLNLALYENENAI